MFLHPSCQVLNHGIKRIFNREDTSFLIDFNDVKFEKFLKYAIFISQGGKRGSHGGSITKSHAFDSENLRQIYQQRYGNLLTKNNIKCLYWKDSMRLSNFIKKNNVDLLNVIEREEKLRFIFPIRNPLDCAISNCKTGHAKHLVSSDSKNYSVPEVLDRILKEIARFLDLYNSSPNNFFYFFENDINENLFVDLANFLQIEPDRQWIEDCGKCSQIKKSYDYDPDLIEYYLKSVQIIFENNPYFLERLAKFCEK